MSFIRDRHAITKYWQSDSCGADILPPRDMDESLMSQVFVMVESDRESEPEPEWLALKVVNSTAVIGFGVGAVDHFFVVG